MSKLAVLVVLIAGVSSILVDRSPIASLPVALTTLGGFPSKISQSFGEDKAQALVNFINTGASIYRADLERNLKYIWLNMEVAFGQPNRQINVIIQESSTDKESVFPAVFPNITAYASLPTGICAINPKWSYFVFIREKLEEGLALEYVSPLGQGKNVNAATINAFKAAVRQNEREGPCDCWGNANMLIDLGTHEMRFWNGVCHTEPITAAYVHVKDGQWISAKPYSCYYTLFAIL